MIVRLVLALAIVQGIRAYNSWHVSPGLELQPEDYSVAREHFQTRLVQHGPAPQNGAMLRAPVGAVQVVYSPDLQLQAWLTPDNGGGSGAGRKRPAVLFLHGGFALSEEDWEMARPYRDVGYVVMMPALRGENGQSGDYSMFYNEVNDAVAAAEYLAKVPYVDATHMYMAGHSVGGTLTLLTAMTTTRIRAAASFSGSPDQIAWSQPQPEVIPFQPKDRREFQMRSPIAYATSFKCPVRLYCGKSEPYFPDAIKETAKRAKTRGLDVEAAALQGDHMSAVIDEIPQSLRFFQSR